MKPIITVSACILGNKVRYDGGDTHVEWVTQKLAQCFELRPICPEMEMGLGAPRETMNLIDINSMDQGAHNIRLISTKTKRDLTDLADLSIGKILSRDSHGVCGHIFQQRSPSCGVEQVKLYNSRDELIIPSENNRGLYAKEFIKRFPFVPVIESIKLSDVFERENFLYRVMAYFRFHALKIEEYALLDFHTRYQLLLMERSPSLTDRLNSIASNHQRKDPLILFENYKSLFFEALSLLPTKINRMNALEHLLGLLKHHASEDEQKWMLKTRDEYFQNMLSHTELIEVLKEIINKNKQYDFLKSHYYFDPIPMELIE
ncbi:MAG: DUF1722 domain-containing protein [Bacteriovorax sp.]